MNVAYIGVVRAMSARNPLVSIDWIETEIERDGVRARILTASGEPSLARSPNSVARVMGAGCNGAPRPIEAAIADWRAYADRWEELAAQTYPNGDEAGHATAARSAAALLASYADSVARHVGTNRC